MSSVPKTQSAEQPARATPSSAPKHDADTFGERPTGKDTTHDSKQSNFEPKATEKFGDSRKRQAGDDHS